MKILKQLFCKHENKTCLTNCYGDYIDIASGYKFPTIRSIWKCKDCGKIIKSQYLVKDCSVINWAIWE